MAEKINPLYTATIKLIKLRDAGEITKAEFNERFAKALEKNIKSGYGKRRRNRATGGVIKASSGPAALKKPTAGQVGLKKLPTPVRNKMGYMNKGGAAKKKKK